MSVRAVLVSGVLVMLAVTATAAPVTLPRTKAILDVPAGWTKIDNAALVAAYRSPSGLVLAVTRGEAPNADVWRPKTREAYADQIEKGALAAAGNGTKRLARKLADVNGVPALDLDVRRTDGSALVMRILLFRTYSLALAIEVPKSAALDEARGVITKFAPPRP